VGAGPQIALLTPDATAIARLRRMKLVATGFLVFAAALYALSFQVDAHGYLRAGSEAAMVGGMADWFAVTAIFRRPLGLPIPHTALIPSRKDDLAARLGSYVTDTFLTPDIVAAQIRDREIVTKTAHWLTDPAQAERIARDIAELADSMLDVLDPAEITVVLLSAAKVDATNRLYAPLIGQLLETTVKDESHRAVSRTATGSCRRSRTISSSAAFSPGCWPRSA
jgi:uncharacterized membrane-anchored protein YjiN (DUF445 family)